MCKEITAERLNKVNNILIWGVGYHTEEVLRFYKTFFEQKHLWITDKNKAGEYIGEYEIIPSGNIDYSNVDLVVIMSAIYHDEIKSTLINKYNYQGAIIGVYAFRRMLLELDSYSENSLRLDNFVDYIECGMQSYSYDYFFKEKFSCYKRIKMYAWNVSSIGESVRYLAAYYYSAFKNKPEDEYYILAPYSDSKEFANGRFVEIASRTVPMITYENCHFWRYLFNKYPERFECTQYNYYNNTCLYTYDPYGKTMYPDYYFCDKKLPVIFYTPEEKKYAVDKLKQWGISGDFVCVFARDNTYANGRFYVDINMRNMNIESFEYAEEYLLKRQIKTIRMGKVVEQPVDLLNCIDYAFKYHSDFMDLYLLGKCKFYAGSLSGIVELAHIQNVPVVLLGVVQIGLCYSLLYKSSDIYIPKKVYSKKENRILSFTEMWDFEMDSQISNNVCSYYQEHELEFIECSQEEIKEAIIEMNEKIDGTYIEDDIEKELQRKYRDLLDDWIERNGYKYSYFLHCNISGSFIKKNAFLLEERNE